MKKIKKYIKGMKGSALVAVLLVLFALTTIALSIMSRSVTSLNVSTDSRKSNVAYQSADQNVEKVLNQIRNYDADNNETVDNIKISKLCAKLSESPLISPPATFCSVNNIKFYDFSDPPVELAQTASIAEIARFDINSNEDGSVERAISAPVPTRINYPTNIAISAPVGVCNPSCNSPFICQNVQWKYEYDNIGINVSGFIIKSIVGASNIAKVISNPLGACNSANDVCSYNACVKHGNPGEKVSVKAKNKANFKLDSVDVFMASVGWTGSGTCDGLYEGASCYVSNSCTGICSATGSCEDSC